ncbi:MAG: TetR/AcrR family transcriptional regulator [Thermaurantimonas sp.]|uniref:TetR/AcrR family transcriptional regulator n=1 Tax=Thermaurantimonas sp. TaxID=2681568 RepID=UPI00391CC0B7
MKRADAERNRNAIVRTARKLFLSEGPQVNLSDIIKRSGLSRITFYRHFSSKSELIHAIFERNLMILRWYAQKLQCDEKGFEKLLSITASMHLYFHELSLYVDDPERKLLNQLISIFRPLADCAKKQNKIRKDFDPENDLVLLIMMISGAIVFSESNEKKRDLKRAYQMLLEGIKNRDQ